MVQGVNCLVSYRLSDLLEEVERIKFEVNLPHWGFSKGSLI